MRYFRLVLFLDVNNYPENLCDTLGWCYSWMSITILRIYVIL